jgi:hypothetical protein
MTSHCSRALATQTNERELTEPATEPADSGHEEGRQV